MITHLATPAAFGSAELEVTGETYRHLTFITDPPGVEKLLRDVAARHDSAAGRGPPDGERPAPGQRVAS